MSNLFCPSEVVFWGGIHRYPVWKNTRMWRIRPEESWGTTPIDCHERFMAYKQYLDLSARLRDGV